MAALAALLLAGVVAGYVVHARQSPAARDLGAQSVTAHSVEPGLQVLSNGVLSTVSLSDPQGARALTPLQCDRAHAAAGTVACLVPVDAFRGTHIQILDRQLRLQREIPLTGFPNRLRVSASGRMVAWTLFVDGHSYATTGFSTSAGILDTKTGTLVPTLEDFASTVDGKPYAAADKNFWGVTFAADDNRFYATMSTGGQRYLVEGDFAARKVRAIARNVECPSLSADGRRIAFKAAVDGHPRNGWRLSVLDLATMAVTPTAETRSVDDQPLWLDSETIAYALQRDDGVNDVWTVAASSTGQPHLLVPQANSPALVN
ncbi:hypothetical protein [Rhizocola hellebori]|uniref:hypothetical protein n=1 Tax=Rhizocola hellebori TaxID=1392758 RepID=UPI001EF37AFB|nr:hypothetical protein [Rhizocola hellebori]